MTHGTRKKRAGKAATFGERLIAGLTEAVAIERGLATAPRTTRRQITAREAAAFAAPKYSKTAIRKLRADLGLSQPVFAEALNVSPATVRAWEIGQKSPSGPALRLLQMASQHPDWVLSQVQAR